ADAAASGRPGVGSGTAVPRSRELVRTARTSSTTKLTSTAKPSRERTARESEPKPATSEVPSVSAENSAPEPAVPRSASTNRATTRLYATTRSTAPRLITASAAVVARGPPTSVTGSRWLIAPSSTCSRKPATKGTVSCCTSAATREVAICSSAERHHITSSPAAVSAEQRRAAQQGRADQRPGDRAEDGQEHAQQPARGPGRRGEFDARAQHGGPQGQQRARHRQTHEAQHVHDLVGEHQPSLPGLARAE